MIRKYKTIPITVETVELTNPNLEFLFEWLGSSYVSHIMAESNNTVISMKIKTDEGIFKVMHNDFIIKYKTTGFYICTPEKFQESFQAIQTPYVRVREVIH